MRNVTYCQSYTSSNPLSIQRTLDKSILTQEFASQNKYTLYQYVTDRLLVIDVVISHKIHEDELYIMGELARDFIYCLLQQIEVVLPLIQEELDQFTVKRISDAQALFIKRLEWFDEV